MLDKKNLWNEMDINYNNENLIKREDVEDGRYIVSVSKMDLIQSKNGLPMVSISFKIADYVEKYGGKVLFFNQVLTNRRQLDTALNILNKILKPYDVKLEFTTFTELGSVLEEMTGNIKNRGYILNISTTKKGYRIFKIEE